MITNRPNQPHKTEYGTEIMDITNSDTLIGLVSQYSPSGQERGAVEWLMKRMKNLGNVEVPQEAFLAVLESDQ